MACYENFAQIYDLLMDEVDYEKWAEFLNLLINKNKGIVTRDVLDLACGTGNITIPMARLGYNLWGIDVSEQMLSIAENKARMCGEKIRFLRQDMRNLNLTKKFDAVLCACDGINYITDDNELTKVLQGVNRILNPGGLFIFDISSFYKLKKILGDNIFIEEKDGIFYSWENEFDDCSSIVTMRLNFFVPDGKLYRRIEEIHFQKAYKIEDIYEILKETDFSEIEVFDEFRYTEPSEESERIFFVAKKC